jgi:large subunit ribosomal protein L36
LKLTPGAQLPISITYTFESLEMSSQFLQRTLRTANTILHSSSQSLHTTATVAVSRSICSQTLSRTVLSAQATKRPTSIVAAAGNGVKMATEQVRGMKVRSSVKKLCEGCKVCSISSISRREYLEGCGSVRKGLGMREEARSRNVGLWRWTSYI